MQIYDRAWAENYEHLAEMSIPGRSGLYRLCHASLIHLPSESHVLVVGCGTGTELISLAQAHPGWTFDAIDPSEGMLGYCRTALSELDLEKRVRTHQCALSEFTPPRRYDATTAILVSQHITDATAAAEFFGQIHASLRPGGVLFSADLHIAQNQSRHAMLDLWFSHAKMSGAPDEMLTGARQLFESTLRPRDEDEILKLVSGAGFRRTLRVFSSLLYGAWRSERDA